MSRIGKQSVTVPQGVKITLDPSTRTITAEGPGGRLSYVYRPEVHVHWDESEKTITCSLPEAQMKIRQMRAFWGTVRARIAAMVKGVTEGFEKKLEVIGVGWNAQPQGRTLRLNVGYCLPVDLTPPEGVEFAVNGNVITVRGPDKRAVGQFAADIRASRPPEPYNGKGIKYAGEQIIRKQGKVFGA
ncbi:MAG: 50S ribosomal protein L6 [Planctomycetota bacterium]|nr:50S ribosomal protein L6 [Planctomycetota bacterium]